MTNCHKLICGGKCLSMAPDKAELSPRPVFGLGSPAQIDSYLTSWKENPETQGKVPCMDLMIVAAYINNTYI